MLGVLGTDTWKLGVLWFITWGKAPMPPASCDKLPSLVDVTELDRLKAALRGGCTPRRTGSTSCPPEKSLQHPKQHLQRKHVQKKLSSAFTAINRAGLDVIFEA